MHTSRRLLQTPSRLPSAPPPEPLAVDSDVVVILAALLCALICVVGLALVARCAWLRRSSASAAAAGPPAPPNKGLKKKALRALPKLAFHAGAADARLADCPICLAEFAEGDEIRVLPQCGHGFHVACVDMWLASHSSCPSCRQILVPGAPAPGPRCDKCGASSGTSPAAPPPATSAGASSAPPEERAKAREDGDAHRFLP